MPKPDPEAGFRFWRRVRKSNNCWMWGNGKPRWYGKVYMGKINGERKYEAAHRLSWKIHRGPIPGGLMVLHQCDTPRCVNPNHLFLGTTSDNLKDCVSKGRHGSQLGKTPVRKFMSNAKLKPCEVKEIRRLRTLGVSGMLLAKMFPVVGFGQIYNICKRQSWKELS